MMESIEKLRERSHLDDERWTLSDGRVMWITNGEPNDPSAVNWGEQWRKIAYEIEREISERYMELPVDADGVPIRVGDVMENLREDLEPKLHHRFKVYGIQYRDYGQVCTLTEDGRPSILYRANECRHYHAPTVEDVLREFGRAYHSLMVEIMSDVAHDMPAPSEIIAKYAAEIRELMEASE